MRAFAALLLGSLLTAWAASGTLRAEGPSEAAPPLREATAEEAKPLVADLEAAAKRKKASEALALLAKLEGLKHADFEKPLQRLLKHAEAEVALKAAELLEDRSTPEGGKGLWAASWGQPVNEKRPAVRARALRAIGRLGVALDKRQADEVERMWRGLQGTPNRTQAPLLVDIAVYVERVKDKRFARQLAEAIDEPVSGDANSPTNPPASYWEEKWHLWDASKAAVHAALKALTGQDFDSTEKARAWIESHAKDGFDW